MSPVVLALLGLALFLVWRTPLRKPVLLAGGGLVVLWLVLTGKLHALFALLAAAIPFGQRIWQVMRLWPMVRQFLGKQQAPKTSEVKTASVHMILNLDSGSIEGDVLDGPFQGQPLTSLSVEQLREQIQWADAHDPEASALLRQFLQGKGESAGEQTETADAPEIGSMTRKQAAEILGVDENADAAEVRKAHRSLIGKLHPDKGGNDYLASLLNAAKARLLG